MNSIREIDNNSRQIVDVWPQYKSADGFRLVWYSILFLFVLNTCDYFFQIESDFVYVFGERNEVLDNLTGFCNLMLEKVFPKRINELRENGGIDLLNRLLEEKSNRSEGRIKKTLRHESFLIHGISNNFFCLQ